MAGLIHASWLSASRRPDAPHADIIAEHLDGISGLPGIGRSAAYSFVEGSDSIGQLRAKIARLRESRMEANPPNFVVLTEVASVTASAPLHSSFGPLPDEAPNDGFEAHVVARAVFNEISSVSGPHQSEVDGFAPAIQFGAFSMASPDDEWALAEWYETVRLPSIESMPGAVRARRFSSVCGLPKFAVLYEFLSLQAHHDGFVVPHESRALDEEHPTGKVVVRTVHAPMAPYIGVRLDA